MPLCETQWECMACGYANGFVRIRCRNCGSAQFEGTKLKPNPILPVAADRDPGSTQDDRTCPHGCRESDNHPGGCSQFCGYCMRRETRPEAYRLNFKKVASSLADDIRKSSVNVLRYSEIEKKALLASLDSYSNSETPEPVEAEVVGESEIPL
jgi:hypothetical protein